MSTTNTNTASKETAVPTNKPVNELTNTDSAVELLQTGKTLWNMNEKEKETYLMRKRALHRMEDLSLSVYQYAELVESEASEREYLGLPEKVLKIHASTLFRWQTLEKEQNKGRLARGRGGIGRNTQMPDWAVCLILEKLNVDPHVGTTRLHEILMKFATHYGYYMPAVCTIWRFVREIRKKGGLQDMLRKLQTRRFFSAYQLAVRHIYSHANHIWETDATRVPILVLENCNGKEKRKPLWLLLTIDCFSGLIVGWTILFGDPNTNDLIGHVHHCLVRGDKKYWGGKPVIIQSDNGMIYKSRGFGATCEDLGINMRKSPPYCPAYNGCIERLNATLKDQLGANFAGAVKKYKIFSKREEVFTGSFAQLKEIIDDCIIEYNTVRGPSGQKATYLSTWMAGLKTEDDGYYNPEEADLHCLAFEDLHVSRQGVNVLGAAWFTHERLEPLVGKQVAVRYNRIGAPSRVKALIGDQWVVLDNPTSPRLADACKDTRSKGLEGLHNVEHLLRTNAEETMHLHTRGTARALTEKRIKPLPDLPAPAKPLTIPTLPTAKLSF